MKKLIVSLLLCVGYCSVFESSIGMQKSCSVSTTQQVDKQLQKVFRCISRSDMDEAEQIISNGGIDDINRHDEYGRTFLQATMRKVYFYDSQILNFVTFLILKGANIRDQRGRYYESPIRMRPMDIFVSDNCINVSCLVAVAKNLKIDIYNDPCCLCGSNIFLFAIFRNRQDIVKYLLKTNDAIWNSRDKSGSGPVRYAFRSGDLKMLSFVLQNGGNINETDKKGWTLLHELAYYYPYPEDMCIAQLVLQQPGIDINRKDANNHTPLDVAKISNNEQFISLLSSCDGCK